MTKTTSAKVWLVAVLFVAVAPVCVQAASDSWLYGTWSLTYDPDGGKDDWLDFYDNGTVLLRGKKGPYAKCDYSVQTEAVVLNCPVRNTRKELRLTIKGTNLVNPSGALYSKIR